MAADPHTRGSEWKTSWVRRKASRSRFSHIGQGRTSRTRREKFSSGATRDSRSCLQRRSTIREWMSAIGSHTSRLDYRLGKLPESLVFGGFSKIGDLPEEIAPLCANVRGRRGAVSAPQMPTELGHLGFNHSATGGIQSFVDSAITLATGPKTFLCRTIIAPFVCAGQLDRSAARWGLFHSEVLCYKHVAGIGSKSISSRSRSAYWRKNSVGLGRGKIPRSIFSSCLWTGLKFSWGLLSVSLGSA